VERATNSKNSKKHEIKKSSLQQIWKGASESKKSKKTLNLKKIKYKE